MKSYHVYYDTKHLSSGNWVVYCTEYVDDDPGVTTIVFSNLNSTEARKACAALRKAFSNGKKQHRIQLSNRLNRE